MPKKTFRKLSRSVRANIRSEKAEIRKSVTGEAAQGQKIVELYSRFGISTKA